MPKKDKTDKSKEEHKPVPDLKPKEDVKGGGKPAPFVPPVTTQPGPPNPLTD